VIAAYAACLTVLAAFAMIGGVLLYDATGPSDPAEAAADRHAFNFVTWELQHFPQKWLYKIGNVFRDDEGSDDDILRRYFDLNDAINRLATADPASDALRAAEAERVAMEARVEDIIEGRVTSLIEDQSLALEPPLFSDLGLVFPPVDFELESPPRVLAISPRTKIELEHSWLLAPGLSRETSLEIESGVEDDDPGVSALVVTAGGVATYPSVINEGRSYESLIDTVSHEWLHQYLVFFPLGRSYFEGSETRTLNESVASIFGHVMAEAYFEVYDDFQPDPPPATPAPTGTPSPGVTPAPTPEPFDFTQAMRALRVRVEAMLADGRVDEAEALMNAKRDEFEEAGYFIRRLNQAYFAFHGFYGDSPASIDPIGPKVQTLLDEAGSPGEFIRRVRSITSRVDLDDALATD
jgi:hypothetical protein